MNNRTRKMLLIITIILALGTILFKTILNSDYYNIVNAINKNYEEQNPIDYQDEEINKEENTQNEETTETENTTNQQDGDISNQIDNNETVDTNVVEDKSNESQNSNTEETTMPSRPTIEM